MTLIGGVGLLGLNRTDRSAAAFIPAFCLPHPNVTLSEQLLRVFIATSAIDPTLHSYIDRSIDRTCARQLDFLDIFCGRSWLLVGQLCNVDSIRVITALGASS
jgi:hypothetical protein